MKEQFELINIESTLRKLSLANCILRAKPSIPQSGETFPSNYETGLCELAYYVTLPYYITLQPRYWDHFTSAFLYCDMVRHWIVWILLLFSLYNFYERVLWLLFSWKTCFKKRKNLNLHFLISIIKTKKSIKQKTIFFLSTQVTSFFFIH